MEMKENKLILASYISTWSSYLKQDCLIQVGEDRCNTHSYEKLFSWGIIEYKVQVDLEKGESWVYIVFKDGSLG